MRLHAQEHQKPLMFNKIPQATSGSCKQIFPLDAEPLFGLLQVVEHQSGRRPATEQLIGLRTWTISPARCSDRVA